MGKYLVSYSISIQDNVLTPSMLHHMLVAYTYYIYTIMSHVYIITSYMNVNYVN